jgi:ERCC4-related helicase
MGPADLEKRSLLKDLVGILEAEQPINITISSDYGDRLSPKVECLIKFLVKEEKPGFSGLIFVQQRAVVSVLSQILSVHPDTMHRFKCASFVGLSNNANGKLVVGDLTDTAAQSQALNEFREGCKNLIVTTDALEEGIDVPACHFVVSYNNLPTLKSFVQRRGRARQRESLFGIMVPQNDKVAFDVWQKLEEEMVAAYQNEFRPSQVSSDSNCAEGDDNVDDILRVSSTE